MASWTLTLGLQHLRAQVDAAFPARDRASDGTIGDQVHASGTSGHNPDRTGSAEYKDGDALDEVRAWDMDSDLRADGVTTQQVVDHIRGLPGVSSVLRYMIWNHKIYQASTGWKPEAYTGPSPHTEHVHFSGARSQAADSNTSFDYRLEDLVSLSPDDKSWAKANLGPYADVVPRWTVDGQRVAATDTNPTMAVSEGIFYVGATIKQVQNQLAALGTSLTAALGALAKQDHVDEKALATQLVPGLVAGVLAGLPADRDDITPSELQDAIVGALKILVDRSAA